MPSDVRRYWGNPVRLSGLLSVLMLALPGTLAGATLLLAYAQSPAGLPVVPAALHAQLQLLGFFLILIWGFLVHGLPGMLGAKPQRTKAVRWWMLALAAALALLWGGSLLGRAGLAAAGGWAVVASVTGGSYVLVAAALRGTHDWREMPYPVLVAGLALPPAAALLYQLGESRAASQLLLRGAVVPIILAMAHRMFSSMVRMRHPRERTFAAAAALWYASVALGALPLEALRPAAAALSLAAALAFGRSLGVWEPRRPVAADKPEPRIDASLALHIRIAFTFLAAAGAVDLAVALGFAEANAYYWTDVARHAATVGFALVLVMGLTQRVFPTFLRGKPSSAGWMNANLALVTAGLLLRTGEVALPAAAPLVAASAYVTYAGIASYAVHLARAMFVKATIR